MRFTDLNSKMKFIRLVLNVYSPKETSQTHSNVYVEDLLTMAEQKGCAKMVDNFI